MSRSSGQLLQHLPALYHASEELCRFLSLLEEVLLGPGADGSTGLEQKIAAIPRLFDPASQPTSTSPGTPEKFLPWLARWVALADIEGLSESQLRQLIACIVPLYAQRGTKAYLEAMLRLFLPEHTVIVIRDQDLLGLVVGDAKLGLNSWLERERPFWFLVEISSALPITEPEKQQKLRQNLNNRARSVIDLAKPAHTAYQLEWKFAQSP